MEMTHNKSCLKQRQYRPATMSLLAAQEIWRYERFFQLCFIVILMAK